MSKMNSVYLKDDRDTLTVRAQKIFDNRRHSLFKRTDRLFAVLMLCQWLAAIAIALVISPLAWSGAYSTTHIHVWAAIFLGGAIAVCPIILSVRRPGQVITRHAIAVSQMLFSALLIHLTGGRIETHFHVFGSLAFLAAYSDWPVLVSASVVIILDHILRGLFWPLSVYGVNMLEPLRWFEHAWWVVFEDMFLIKACLGNVEEMHKIAQRQAEVEDTRERVTELVKERTRELHISERKLLTQYAVAQVLAEASSLTQAAPLIVGAIATNMVKDIGTANGSVYGEVWQLDKQTGLLTSVTHMQMSDNAAVEPFHSPREIRFAPDIGLPGRVLSSRSALQITDITEDERFTRREIALRAGFKAAFAFPVMAEGEVAGVIQFLSESQRHLTHDEFAMLESLGRQIGQFVVAKRIEAENVQLASIVQSSNDAIIGRTLDGFITSWNRGAEKMFGYSATEAKGQNIGILVPMHKKEELIDFSSQDARGIESYETERLAKSGRCIDISIVTSPIRDAAGDTIGISEIGRDVTERKQAEKRVTEFISTVSHELRSPLTSIRGSLGLIEGDIVQPNSDEGRELIQVARSSCDRLIRLINDILDLKKIEAGKIELQIERLDAAELIKGALNAMAGMAEEAGIELIQKGEITEHLLADKDRTFQVLTNLISNAIKFSPAGSTVTVHTEPGSPGRLRFLISDTGPGIASEQLSKLFHRFQQLDSSDTRTQGGTGLGLAISRAIVEEHGGEIGVNSNPPNGSTFWFELPMEVLSDSTDSNVAEQDEAFVTDRSASFGVLLIEDDSELSRMLQIQLSVDGYKLNRVNTLFQARQFLRHSTPKVIVLDLTLPDGDGLELVAELRENPATQAIPVIVITGRSEMEEQLHSPIIFDWLMKPFQGEHLLQSIERALGQTRMCKVLVVDDDADTRFMLSVKLRAMRLECIEASDGFDAIKLTRAKSPDLIILDVSLPGMDGFTVVDTLRREQAGGTPLIVYTGKDLDESERRSLSLGMTKYLTKGSIFRSELPAAVRELIGFLGAEPSGSASTTEQAEFTEPALG